MNFLLSEKLVSMKHQCWANTQYSRRECLELVDIPRSISDDILEEKVLQVFERVGFPTEGNSIRTFHLISKIMKSNSEVFSLKAVPKNT